MKAGKWVTRIQLLRRCLRLLNRVASIVKELYPEATIYIIGGAAENRLTVYSDIDVAVVFKEAMDTRTQVEVLDKIWEALEKEIPLHCPFHIIVIGEKEFSKLGGTKKKLL